MSELNEKDLEKVSGGASLDSSVTGAADGGAIYNGGAIHNDGAIYGSVNNGGICGEAESSSLVNNCSNNGSVNVRSCII